MALKVWLATLFAALAVLVALRQVPSAPPVRAAAAAKSVAAQDSTAAVPVNGSRALVPPVRLTLTGEIVGLATPDTSSIVLVRVGSQVVPASVSGNVYSASIVAAPETMIRVEVESLRVHYRSLLGSAALLKRRSGGDGRLVTSEHAMLLVSPMSTAIAFLSNHVLDARDPASDIELERTWRGLATGPGVWTTTATDLTAAAHVLAQAANGTLALPSGFATGYQLLQDRAAFNSVLDQNGTRSASLDYPFRTAEYVALGSLSEIPDRQVFMHRVPVLDIPNGATSTQLLIKKPANRFEVQLSAYASSTIDKVPAPAVQPQYDASITSAGELLLLPVTQTVTEVYLEGRRTHMTIRARKFRRLVQGDRHALWASWTEWDESYPDRSDLAPAIKSSVEVWSAANVAEVAKPIAWNTQSLRVALPSFCMKPSTTTGAGDAVALCEVAQHRFDPNGTGVTEDIGWKVDTYMQPKAGTWGTMFSWTSLDDQKRMRVSNGNIAVNFWIIDAADAFSDLILFEAQNQAGLPAGQTLVGVVLAVSGDYVPFTSAHAPGTWKLAGSVYDLSYPEAFAPSYFVRHADGKASEYLDVEGMAGPPVVSNWVVTGERLYDVRYRARFGSNPRYVENCAAAFAAGATDCGPSRIRYFRPVARSGKRIYGFTDFYHQFSYYPQGYAGPYTVVRGGGGVTYYDCTDGSCLSYAPAQLSSSAPMQATSPLPQTENRPAHANLRVPLRHLRSQLRSTPEAVRR